ncbi:MAG: hypothetical protein M1827_001314 [Pycnora praestabilis]|nr:MAG: hypothetical protein M1827_001314 [Pycnora praestabilis]
MPSATVPKTGLPLRGRPSVEDGGPKLISKSTQAMQLTLAGEILDDLLKSARGGGKGIYLSFGKSPTLHYGSKTRDIVTSPEGASHELYLHSTTDHKPELSFAGLLSHKLGIRKAEEIIAGTDTALSTLQDQMAAIEKDKQSKKTLFVVDNTVKLPPAKSAKRSPAKSRNSNSSLKAHRTQLFSNGTTCSMPTSPALGASRSPLALSQATTSAPVQQNQRSSKLQALRTPLIHLLAIGPSSDRELAQKTRCAKADCLQILERICKPTGLNSERELTDRAYKELDVWKFSYPSQDDRQAAIDNAVSAFDRLRLSREDQLWQLLLPGEERGKGKVLSKLQLRADRNKGDNTPSIKIQHTDKTDGNGTATGDESEDVQTLQRPANNVGESMVRSASHDPIAKKKISEKEALSKRLLSKNQKRTGRPPAKSKLTEPEDSVKANGKIKSAEFVEESDSDVETKGAVDGKQGHLGQGSNVLQKDRGRPLLKHASKPLPSSTPFAGVSDEEHRDPPAPGPTEKTQPKNAVPPSPTSSSSHKSSDAGQSSSSTQASKNDHSSRKQHRSSQKPSPLGSSPPTNASDVENENESENAQSIRSSPAPSQLSKGTVTPTPSSHSSHFKSTLEKPPQNASEKYLKRKAADMDSSIHIHDRPVRNGHQDNHKRHHTNTGDTPLSDSSSSTSPPSSYETLMLARRFKEYWAKYEKLHQEVSTSPGPDPGKLETVKRMHDRLVTMKADIEERAATNN